MVKKFAPCNFFLKSILKNKLIICCLVLGLLVNIIILPILVTNITSKFNIEYLNNKPVKQKPNYLELNNFENLIIYINIGIGIIFGSLNVIAIFNNNLENGIELLLNSMPYSRKTIFFQKILALSLSTFVFSFTIPVFFLIFLLISINEKAKDLNQLFGYKDFSDNFLLSWIILWFLHFSIISFFIMIFILISLFWKKLSLLIIAFLLAIILPILNLVPKPNSNIYIAQEKYLLEQKKVFNQGNLSQDVQLIEEEWSLIPSLGSNAYLEEIKLAAQNIEQMLFEEESFSKIAVQDFNNNNYLLNFLNSNIFVNSTINLLYKKNLTGLAQTEIFSQQVNKKNKNFSSSLSSEKDWVEKQKILGKKIGLFQEQINFLKSNIANLQDYLFYQDLPNDNNINYLLNIFSNGKANNIFPSLLPWFANRDLEIFSYDGKKVKTIPLISEDVVDWNVITNAKGQKIALDYEVKNAYLKLLTLAKEEETIYDTMYQDIIPFWLTFIYWIILIVLFLIVNIWSYKRKNIK